MKLGFNFLEELIQERKQKLSDLAAQLEITPQAIQTWKTTNEVPSKRIAQISKLFSLDGNQIEKLFGRLPLQLSFRTKRGEHQSEIDVSERIKVRAQVMYERLFSGSDQKLKYDLTNVRKKILEAGRDFRGIANCIRSEFTIPDYRPLSGGDLNHLLVHVGVNSLYMPFKQIGLTTTGDDQTAITYARDNAFSVLIDSDRTIDEGHFDKTHEMIHVIIDGVFEVNDDLEKLIDKVCGELIYPENFLIEKFFDGDRSSKPIKNKELLTIRFYENTREFHRALSPRGLARAMRDADLATRNSELYKYLNEELHEEFRKQSVTFSSYGQMNFNFSDREKLEKFYSNMVDKLENEDRYPLFTKLRNDLLQDNLPLADFADTFGLEYFDALVLKAGWEESANENK